MLEKCKALFQKRAEVLVILELSEAGLLSDFLISIEKSLKILAIF